MKGIFTNEIIRFVITFCILFGVLYFLNYFIIGLTIPGGYYNAWVAAHMDYVSAYRSFILKGASVFVSLFGFENFTDKYQLHLPGISRVRMVYSCIGFDVLCFWWAFAIAFPQKKKQKVIYFFAGTVFITLLNMMRVGGLAMVRSVKSLRYQHINHHLIFNVVVYIFIFLMIMKMVNGITNRKTTTTLQ